MSGAAADARVECHQLLGLGEVARGVGVLEVGNRLDQAANGGVPVAAGEQTAEVAIDLGKEPMAAPGFDQFGGAAFALDQPGQQPVGGVVAPVRFDEELVMGDLVAEQVEELGVGIEELEDAAGESDHDLVRSEDEEGIVATFFNSLVSRSVRIFQIHPTTGEQLQISHSIPSGRSGRMIVNVDDVLVAYDGHGVAVKKFLVAGDALVDGNGSVEFTVLS